MANEQLTAPKESKNEQIKTTLICFFNSQGVHKEFVPPGQTVNKQYYCEVLERLRNRGSSCPARDCGHMDAASRQCSLSHCHLCERIFDQKFVHGNGSVTWSIVVMQHPSVRNLWPDTMNPFSESFKDLFINCLSWRHEFVMNNTLTVEKTN